MRRIRARRPDAHLRIAGGALPADCEDADAPWVTHVGYLSREELLTEFLPSCEVFAYPSRFDGLPLTLLEALASGVPCVVSDYFALPEVVDASCGRVVGTDDPGGLADAVVELLDTVVNGPARNAARRRFDEAYAPDVVLPELRRNYDLAVDAAGGA